MSSRYNRYNQNDQPTKQELAMERAHEAVQRELAALGHDREAATRARRIEWVQENTKGLLANFPAEHHELIRRTGEQQISEIRASGAVGCACGHQRCVETQPKQDS
jgi:hypothetical protein